MRATRQKPLHNPFQNRFHDPVTWRLDEMQAHSNVIWPQRRSHRSNVQSVGSDSRSNYASAFAFIVVLLASVVVVFRIV
ncbi:MAG TPA: hypothetical protein VIG25_18565 [Pyrinomonadaceae bacterium]